ncbi:MULTISPECIES: hypothetical protein [Staphylococcus]|uniref:Lipoprotein n=1 Tax=Staphylococcus haemolyticus TaxID=1283 RepID=A0A2K0A7U3_STAHA|nr:MULTISPECIES: hypothetical protein [Staphylococcus]KGF27570.1 hypothetical protein HMPREF2135_04545 [Staphylococcus haemolyticus DNF00585]MCH4443397.1 hypothetical protein [Staphylococcus haemolyticus]OFK30455.1 hypothetical protein HMPREF2821_09690 [Staphylococcus sp. HMSC065C10]OFL87698.1 hypothetical protein HMPREF2737_05205 [Staphylococcus sp. HMSC069D12]PNN21091.1 hypothetical protein AL503_010085 [Staphylococcus haemolyticus]
MKKLIVIIGASCLLVGCGSQNLGPLEDKTTKLRDQNHNLKLDIQQLNQDISNQKAQVEALNKDKKNVSKTVDNNKEAKFLDASSKYYQDITKVISNYNQLDLSKNKKEDKKQNLEKLNTIANGIDDAYGKYKGSVTKKDLSSANKNEDKNIRQINKELQSAFKDIKSGYENNNTNKLNKGKTKLSQVNMSNNS